MTLQDADDADVPRATPPGAAPADDMVHLGEFHPFVAVAVEDLLRARDIVHARTNQTGQPDGAVRILIARTHMRRVAADLYGSWDELVAMLERDDVFTVLALGGPRPGWMDAPADAWIDRDGNLQLHTADGIRPEDDARRIAPTVIAIGVTMVLLAWSSGLYSTTSRVLAVLGATTILVGVFLP